LILARGNQKDLVALSIGYGLILLAVWTPQPWQRLFSGAALVWIMLVTWISFETWTELGLHISGSLRALWVVGLALVLAAAAATLAGSLYTLHLPGSPAMFVKRYWGYAIWAFLQEFLLLDFVLLRLLRLLPDKKAAMIAATVLFGIAHLPNPILTPATLVWGFAACLLFLQYRNLYTLALAHAIFGICVAATIPGPVTHNMKVGLGYLTYRPPVITVVVPGEILNNLEIKVTKNTLRRTLKG
jgi:membrane protease YdiL (CAAX protease family)